MKILLFITALLASQIAPARVNGAIEGSVINAITMLPLADTPITLSSGTFQIRTVSDQSGRFLIPNISPGPYTVAAVLEDYFAPELNGASPTEVMSNVFVMEAQISRMTLAMVPAGTIRGTVVDDRGAPAIGATVQLMRIIYPNGIPRLSNVGSQTTDDQGSYRISGLRPGEYYAAAAPKQSPSGVAPGTAVLVRTFFPSALDLSQASMIRVHAGQEASGVHITFQKGNAFRISGQVLSAISEAGASSTITLLARGSALQEPNSTRTVAISMGSPGNGRFELSNVFPGLYDLYASLPGGRGYGATYGRTIVAVGGADQEGVIVTVQPGIDIRGRVTVDGGASPSFNSIRISLQPEDSAAVLGAYQQVSRFQPIIGADGTFNIPAVPEALYRVQVTFAPPAPLLAQPAVVANRPVITDPLAPNPTPPPALVTVPLAGAPLGPNAYVADILQAGLSVFNSGVQVGTQAIDALDVRVRTDGGSVDGLVLDAKLTPYAGATVVLAPLVQDRQNPALYRTAMSDESGRFTMTRIRPGEYKLLAWDSIAPGAFMNAEVLSNYKDFEIPITIPANIHVQTRLTVITSR